MTEIKKRLIKLVALPMILVGTVLIVSQTLPIGEWLVALNKQSPLSNSKRGTVLDYLDNLGNWSFEQLQRSRDSKITPLSGAFQERVITRETFLYDKDGKSIKKLEPGKIVRLLIPEKSLRFDGFSENCVLVSIVQVTDEEIRGYVRESAVSAAQPADYWLQKTGAVEAEWWDLPLEGKQILHKGVKLMPGQKSSQLSFVIQGQISYRFWTPSPSVALLAWVNGKEIVFSPDGHQECPHIRDLGIVQVQLSSLEAEAQTIRFVVSKE